jgi:hypothetical protein
MTTKKVGLVLAILGTIIFLASWFVDYAGMGKRSVGASQILGMETGIFILLFGIYLAYFYPHHQVNVWIGMRAGPTWLFHLPMTAWIILGFLIIYFFFFLSPVFFNSQRVMWYYGRFLPNQNPIGLDIRAVLRYVQDWLANGQSPYADGFIAYPPLGLLLFTPLVLMGYPAYYFFITCTTLFFYAGSTLFVPWLYNRAANRVLVPLMFVLGLFSYGFQFEVERGQSNIIAFSLALIGVYLYHSRDDFHLPAYFLFSLGVQMKIYPAILIVMFIKDWKDWKGNVIRLAGIGWFNFALLFVMGFQMFDGFLGAVRGQQLLEETWYGNHALKGFVFALASGEYKFFGPAILARFEHHQAQVEILFLAVLSLCFLSVLLLSYFKDRPGLNTNLLVICTICAMVIPSVSNDYKLPILTAPMVMLWCNMKMPDKTLKRALSILLVLITSVAYWSTQYPPGVKPYLLNRNFPALFLILIAVTILSFLAPASKDVPLEDSETIE